MAVTARALAITQGCGADCDAPVDGPLMVEQIHYELQSDLLVGLIADEQAVLADDQPRVRPGLPTRGFARGRQLPGSATTRELVVPEA